MYNRHQSAAFQHGTDAEGNPLTALQRERIMKDLLPDPPTEMSATVRPQPRQTSSPERVAIAKTKPRRKRPAVQKSPFRRAVMHYVYVAVYMLIHFFFSIWLKIRKTARAISHKTYSIALHHHRTPALIRGDVKNPKKIPNHISIVLEQDDSVQKLVRDLAEVVAWSAAVGVKTLSVYEKKGISPHV